MPIFIHRTRLEQSPEEVFLWHTRSGAFERLLPPWENVSVRRTSSRLEEGAEVRIRIRRGPARIDWTVRHTDVEEGRFFRDVQVDGPFRSWNHVHRFRPDGAGGCVLEDQVEWEPPAGKLGRAFAEPLVQRELTRLFRFRARRLEGDLGRLARHPGPPLTIAVSGASGLIGTHLSRFLQAGGHTVLPLVRTRNAPGIYWDIESQEVEREKLEGVDALVHLAAESIFGIRWTRSKKEAIMESRRRGTRLLASTLAGLERPPRVFVSASGVHYYGTRGQEILTEASVSGEGFLAHVCREWEAAVEPADRIGIRTVQLRSGVVLTPAGGALDTMLPFFKLGLGGRLGSGRQYMSWVDLDDEVGLIYHALRQREVEGPMNATAPNPVTNAAFTDTLGRVLSRPTIVPLPGLAVKAGLGEMGDELLLASIRARPKKAADTGFVFQHPHLEACLRHELGTEDAEEEAR